MSKCRCIKKICLGLRGMPNGLTLFFSSYEKDEMPKRYYRAENRLRPGLLEW
jgi:hypothetical protein